MQQGWGERRKCTAQSRHLVNNRVSAVKKISREAAYPFSLRYIPVLLLPLSHSEGHERAAAQLAAVYQALPSPHHTGSLSAWLWHSSLTLQGLCTWLRLGSFRRARAGLCQPLPNRTGRRMQLVVCLLGVLLCTCCPILPQPGTKVLQDGKSHVNRIGLVFGSVLFLG